MQTLQSKVPANRTMKNRLAQLWIAQERDSQRHMLIEADE